MKKELKEAIERIRSGESAIHNDDREKCIEVVRYMFPNDGYNSSGSSSFYYVSEEIDSLWGCDECLPNNMTHTYEASQIHQWMREPDSLEPESPDGINYEEIEVLLVCAGKLKNNPKLEQQVLNIVKQLL